MTTVSGRYISFANFITIMKQKLAIITGATGGIGSVYAAQLAAAQYDLLLVDINAEKIDALAAQLQNTYHINTQTIVADLTDAAGIDMAASKIAALPQIDMLVNCAGFGEKSKFHDESAEAVKRLISIHVSATILLTHAVLPVMMKQQYGDIISVASLAAFIPAPGSSIYSASKAFLTSFTESLHMEVADMGIRVQALCPGLTKTAFHDQSDVEKMNKVKGIDLWMEPEEVVAASLHGLETGHVICIPGGINKALAKAVPALPRKPYYKMAEQLAKKVRKG